MKPPTAITLPIIEAGKGQLFLLASPAGYSSATRAATDVYTTIADILRKRDAVIVHERIFGSLDTESEIIASRKNALIDRAIPCAGLVTFIEGASPYGPGLAGVIIRAIVPLNPADVWTITDQDVPCGRGWRRNGSQFIILQNIQGGTKACHPHLTSSVKREGSNSHFPAFQTQQAIERADRILREQGASYRDVVRTWFYLSNILEWYPEFNRIRNQKYSEFGSMPGHGSGRFFLPASTGVGGINPRKSAAVLDLHAIIGPRDRMPVIKQMTNNRQLDAFHYGSAFSRGVLIHESDISTIHISGTAAIDDVGKSLYPGDARSQIEYTIDQVQSFLGQEGAVLRDIAAATVFVKRPEDASLFREIIDARGIEKLPAVCVIADICRDELLFEMDAEVIINNAP